MAFNEITPYIGKIKEARPDVAADPYYGKNIGEWWGKYGQKEMGTDFLSGVSSLKKPTAFATPAPFDATQATGRERPGGFEFDPAQYLPGIQQTAESIYGPQRAQLEALQSLSASKAEQARVTTKEDFSKQLQGEIEAINRRGAFFSGGAVEKGGEIRTAEQTALTDINLQQQADSAQMLAQQGLLTAEQANYIQKQLYERESGAYGRYQDTVSDWKEDRMFEYDKYTNEKTFNYSKYRAEVGDYQADRSYVRGVFEGDRDFKSSQYEFEKQYKLSKSQFEFTKQKYKDEQDKYDQEVAEELAVARLKYSKKGGDPEDIESGLGYDLPKNTVVDHVTGEVFEMDTSSPNQSSATGASDMFNLQGGKASQPTSEKDYQSSGSSSPTGFGFSNLK